MIDRVEIIIKQLELLMRGGSTSALMEYKELMNLAHQLFSFYHECVQDGKIEVIESNAKLGATVAVKLHNKARNLSTSSHGELRTILKAISAWMLLYYGENSAKIIPVALKLLSRAAQELTTAGSENLAMVCSSSVIKQWTTTSELQLQKELTPLELQELKMAVSSAYLTHIQFYDINNHDLSDGRKTVSSAMELVQTLPPGVKLQFSESVVKLALSCSISTQYKKDAVHFFQIALNTLEIGLTTNKDDVLSAVQKQSVNSSIVKIKLNLAHILMQSSENEKAMSYINEVEDLAKNKSVEFKDMLTVVLAYAKFMIYIQDGELSLAADTLRALLKHVSTKYEMALYCVKQLVGHYLQRDVQQGEIVRSEYYKLLLNKYTNDPNFTTTRLSHFQSIIVQASTNGTDQHPVMPHTLIENCPCNQRAIEICNCIITDHLDAVRPLEDNTLPAFRTLLIERIDWFRTNHDYDNIVKWCDLLQHLLLPSSDESDILVNVLLIKSEALLTMNNPSEAVVNVTKAVNIVKNVRTCAMLLLTELELTCNPVAAVQRYTALKEDTASNNVNNNNCKLQSAISVDQEELMVCCSVVQRSSTLSQSVREATMYLLLKRWVKVYAMEKLWMLSLCATEESVLQSLPNQTAMVESTAAATFLRVSCEILLIITYHHLTMVVSPVRQVQCSAVESATAVTPTALEPVTTEASTVVSHPKNFTAISAITNSHDSSASNAPPSHSQCSNNQHFAADKEIANHRSSNDDDAMRDGDATQAQLHNPLNELVDDCQDMDVEPVQSYTTTSNIVEQTITATATAANSAATPSIDNINLESTLYHYPAMTKQLNDNTTYRFHCSVNEVEKQMLEPIEQLATLLLNTEVSKIGNFGKFKDLEWLSNYAWNIATILVKYNSTHFHANDGQILNFISGSDVACAADESTKNTSGNNNGTNNCGATKTTPCNLCNTATNKLQIRKQLDMAARFFEAAEQLYSFIPFQDNEIATRNRAICRIIAVAVRLDCETMLVQSNHASNSENVKSSSGGIEHINTTDNKLNHRSNASTNLLQARVDAQRVNNLLRKESSEFQSNETRGLRRTSLLLEFATLCKMANHEQCAEFINVRQNDFLMLSGKELQHCSEIAMVEESGALDIARQLLYFALQVCNREVYPDYILMGRVYVKLIELSPSRQTAYDTIAEFEQLALTLIRKQLNNDRYTSQQRQASQPIIADSNILQEIFTDDVVLPFEVDCIDRAASLAYNYGVTLIDLEQAILARSFVEKALVLAQFASATLKAWIPRMQETYNQINRQQDTSAGSSAPNDVIDTMIQLESNADAATVVNTNSSAGLRNNNGNLEARSGNNGYLDRIYNFMTKDVPINFQSLY